MLENGKAGHWFMSQATLHSGPVAHLLHDLRTLDSQHEEWAINRIESTTLKDYSD